MSAKETSIEVLANAIEYPDEVPSGSRDYLFAIDDFEVRAVETGGRLRLSATVFAPARDGSEDERLTELAAYVPGRILKEEAALAWDPDADSLVLWQEMPTTVGANDLRRFFDVFAASCDWWIERVRQASAPAPAYPEMVILP